MTGKMMWTGAMALAAVAAIPATAQMTPSNTQDSTMSNGMSGMNSSDTMTDTTTMAPKMTRSQTAQMKKCQAMSSDRMMKNRACAKLAKTHPEMTQPM